MEHFLIISLDEFKSSPLYETSVDDKTYMEDNFINEAIYNASLLADYLSGYILQEDIKNNMISEENLNIIKGAIERQATHSLRNGIEYIRAQSTSVSGGSISINNQNPADPLYVCVEMFMALKKTGYTQDTSFVNLNIEPVRKLNGFNLRGEYEYGADYITRNELTAYAIPRDGSAFSSPNKTIDIQTQYNPNNSITEVRFEADNQKIAELTGPVLTNDPNFISNISNKLPPLQPDNFNDLLVKDKDFISTQTSLQTLEEDNHLVHTKLIKTGNDWTTISGDIYADSLEEVVSNVNNKVDERVPITDKYYAGDDENLIYPIKIGKTDSTETYDFDKIKAIETKVDTKQDQLYLGTATENVKLDNHILNSSHFTVGQTIQNKNFYNETLKTDAKWAVLAINEVLAKYQALKDLIGDIPQEPTKKGKK